MMHAKVNLKRNKKYRLYAMGDWHTGVDQFREDLFMPAWKEFLDDPNGLFLGMGDYSEFRAPDHKFYDPRSATQTLQEQVAFVTDRFKEAKGRTIGILSGNHEDGLCRRLGYDPYYAWCKENGTQYLGLMAKLSLTFPCGESFTIIATHGHGGGRKDGSSYNRIDDFLADHDVDAAVQGHNHRIGTFVRTELKHEGDEPARVYKRGGFTGSFYDGYVGSSVSYAERGMMRPLPLGYLIIEISPEGMDMRGVYL